MKFYIFLPGEVSVVVPVATIPMAFLTNMPSKKGFIYFKHFLFYGKAQDTASERAIYFYVVKRLYKLG